MSPKTADHFIAAHGQKKVRRLQTELETERKKVEALSGRQNVVYPIKTSEPHLRFGVLGCTHYGSLCCHMDAIREYYRFASEQRGVKTFLNGGDVLDGHRVYRGQEFEVSDVGLERQLKRLADNRPEQGETMFITGNHDQSFKTAAGVPIGDEIAAKTGWKFLGEEQATIAFDTPMGAYRVMLIHPGGGTSYALSYRPQKIVESLEGGTKPDLLCIAHYHKAEFIPSYRNVAVLQTGTFQRQTPFMARQGLAAHVGGWIIEITVGKGVNAVRAEFMPFYV